VTVGDIDRTSPDAITLVIPYTQWIVPKEFIMNGLEHDIAVFNLSSPLAFGAKIKALGLPPASMYKAKGFTMDSKPITIYGYGHAGKFQNLLTVSKILIYLRFTKKSQSLVMPIALLLMVPL
jgi:hypothetical protein